MSILESANIFVTGGAGTLGRAIARRRKEAGWKGKLTVYSTDSEKHEKMRRLYPDVNYIPGDIRAMEPLYNAMAGHDVVIHGAAVKRIPEAEYASVDCMDINVIGSLNVCIAAMRAGVEHVLGISTDKACHPANAYGASKMLMEKIFQEYARYGFDTQYHLVRYGNVLESTGSVIEMWKGAVERGESVKITDENMTRFWLSPSQAVDYVIESLECDPGFIYVPKMPALSIGKLLKYTLGDKEYVSERVPLRPGEKLHETLVTEEELSRTIEIYPSLESEYFVVSPSTKPIYDFATPRITQGDSRGSLIKKTTEPYTSAVARELTAGELEKLLEEG